MVDHDTAIATSGLLTRTLTRRGPIRERQYVMNVVGSIDTDLILGLLAIRWQATSDDGFHALTASIPDHVTT